MLFLFICTIIHFYWQSSLIYPFCNLFQIETIYKNAHAAIRANPEAEKKPEQAPPATQKRWTRRKLTLAERKDRVTQKKKSFIAKLQEQEA